MEEFCCRGLWQISRLRQVWIRSWSEVSSGCGVHYTVKLCATESVVLFGIGALYLLYLYLFNVQCVVCSVQCAVCSLQCAVCSVQCAVCSVQCAARSVQCNPVWYCGGHSYHPFPFLLSPTPSSLLQRPSKCPGLTMGSPQFISNHCHRSQLVAMFTHNTYFCTIMFQSIPPSVHYQWENLKVRCGKCCNRRFWGLDPIGASEDKSRGLRILYLAAGWILAPSWMEYLPSLKREICPIS